MKQFFRKAIINLRAWIGFVLYRWAGEAPVGMTRRLVLRALARKALYPVPISTGVEQNFILRGPSPSVVARPTPVKGSALRVEGRFGELRARQIHGARVSPYSSSVVQGDRLLVPDVILANRRRHSTDGANLFWLGQEYCVGRTGQQDHLPAALLIGGAGAFNWYHFLVECLPKVALAQSLPAPMKDWPLLVPAEYSRIPGFQAALAVFSDGRAILPVPRGKVVQVDRLVVFDEVSYGPFNMYQGDWPVISDYAQHDEFLREYLTRLRTGLLGGQPCPPPTRRIFLVRPTVRRNYNQDALVAIARRYGFEPCSPETLPLSEQARLFASAAMIVGASGAAWVGMAFCEKPARMLSWLPKEYGEFCSYSTLAQLLGHRLEFLTAHPDRPLKNTADAYEHSYKLDEDDFENALKYMTNDAAGSA